MKHLTTILLACSACWGTGPTPKLPDGADIVYALPPTPDLNCNETAPFIGDVAIGGGYAYAAVMPWSPPHDGGCDPSGMSPQVDVPILRAPLPETVGTPDERYGGRAKLGTVTTRVAASSMRGAWVNSPDIQSKLYVDSTPSATQRELAYSGGYYLPSGFVADDTFGFVMATTQASDRDVNDPAYPSSSTNNNGSGTPASTGWRIRWDPPETVQVTIPTDVYIVGDTLKTAVVANTTTLFLTVRYMDLTGDVEIRSMDKEALVADTPVGVVPRDIGVPVGLAANDSWLAWSVSAKYESSLPSPRCGIYTRDLTSPTAEPVRIYTSFTHQCMDTAIDDTHVYFTIVTVGEGDDGDTFSTLTGMTGVGLARVSLAEPYTFESIATGITLESAGPRRVYLDGGDGDGVYAVDPFTIARISKSAFVGKHDF